jgi:hypothetical protein
VHPLEQLIARAEARGDLRMAEARCRRLIAATPGLPDGQYRLAVLLAGQGRRAEAARALHRGMALGAPPAPLAKDPKIAANAALLALAQQADVLPPVQGAPAHPAAVTGNIAWVLDGNTAFDAASGQYRPRFTLDRPAVAARPVTGLTGEVATLLQQWFAEGTAAGNAGDYYDNRDGDHSNLPRETAPQLTYIEYGAEAASLGLNMGVPENVRLDGMVIGNASLAHTQGKYWRSMARGALDDPKLMALLADEYYTGNKLYAYPGHYDFRPSDAPAGHGDVYPANTPYWLNSRGSSYTDKPFLAALAQTLAAFHPEVKTLLAQRGALAPTLQAILRQCTTMAPTPEAYLTGAAHPAVFDGTVLDPLRMIKLAHAMTKNCLPPLVRLRVLEETLPAPAELPDPTKNERFLDTPGAIARIWYSPAHERRLVVSAAASEDLTGRPLTFHWVVLQGDPATIRITPRNAAGSEAEIVISYHTRRLLSPGADIAGNRVDIGVFADNGVYRSAPAFICSYTLDNEERAYDDAGRLQRITYRPNYVDPHFSERTAGAIYPRRDTAGNITGWEEVK